MKLLSRVLIFATFINFTYYLLSSNLFDWEQFYSFIEVDRRSWLNDLNLPFWSYQLCAGTTRIADPQSFGLSPLFIFPLLFGTVLGAKLMVIFCTVIGFIYTKKTFLLLANLNQEEEHNVLYNILTLLYVFSGYFIAHFHVGHLTFMNLHLFAVINYLIFKIILNKKLTKADWSISTVSFFTIFSGGFYAALLFWTLPLGLSCAVFIVFLLFTDRAEAYKKLSLTFSFILIPFLLCSYKLLQVLIYQLTFPRAVGENSLSESNNFWQLLKNLFIPVFDFTKFMFDLPHTQKWGIFENTSFSFFPYLLLLAFLLSRKKNITTSLAPKNLIIFLSILLLVFLLLALGNFSNLSPFNLLNSFLFSDSLRVATRFNLGICFVLFCLLAILFSKIKLTHSSITLVAIPLLLQNIYFYYPFFTYDLKQYNFFQSTPYSEIPSMKKVGYVPQGNLFSSNNYVYLKQGLIVLNCYNPISRHAVVVNSLEHKTPEQVQLFDLLDKENSSANQECLEQIYVKQNSIVLPAECNGTICFNLNGINPAEWSNGYYYDNQIKKYCIKLSTN